MIRPFIKLSNALIAGYSFLKSSVSGRPRVGGMPLAINVELTNFCNLNCPECDSGSGKVKRARGYMEISLFDKIMNEMKPFLFNMNLYFQGEPMLHPQFLSFIAKSGNIRTVVSTNGHFLSEEYAERLASSGLKELIVSLDGMDQEVYSLYRVNGDVAKVFDGLKNVSEAIKRNNSKLKLVIQVLVSRQNEHQVAEIRKYARGIGALLRLKSMQIINKENYATWLPSVRKFRRYELHGNEYVLRNKFQDRCSKLWFNPVITWDGKVVPCCFDKDADHVMGNLNEDSFREIWNGPKYRSFRKSLLSGRYMIEICRNCTSGLNGAKY